MIMQATLTRISSDALRSQHVTGRCFAPTLGLPFQMLAPALFPDTGAIGRLVETSPVAEIDGGVRGWRFVTESGSIYDLVRESP